MPHKDLETRRAYLARNKDKIRARNRAKYLANIEENRAKSLVYIAAHLEERRAYKIAYRQKNQAKIDAYNKAYYTEHRELALERVKNYCRDNREKVTARHHAYRLKNQDHIKARQRAYRLANAAKIQAKNQQRHARQRGASVSDLSDAQWIEIQETQKHRCYYCGKPCKGRLTRDHITPVGPTGQHTLHNIIAACGSCNSRKGTKPPPIPVQPLLLTIAPPRKKKTS